MIKETKILMYDGSIQNIENIKSGDILMNIDSLPLKVLKNDEISKKHNDIIYRVSSSYDDNISTTLFTPDQKILLSLVKENQITFDKNIDGWIVKFIQNFEICEKIFYIADFLNKNEAYIEARKYLNENVNKINKIGDEIIINLENYFFNKSEIWRKYFMAIKKIIHFNEQQLDFDPYVLGYWLVDDESSFSSISINTINNNIYEIIKNEFNRIDMKIEKVKINLYRISPLLIKDNNQFISFIERNRLKGKSNIPNIYKINSFENRYKLLAGIWDSGSWYDSVNDNFVFDIVNEKLMNDFIYLINSLGIYSTKLILKRSTKLTRLGKITNNFYRVIINYDCIKMIDLDKIPIQNKINQDIFNKWNIWNKNKDKINLKSKYMYFSYKLISKFRRTNEQNFNIIIDNDNDNENENRIDKLIILDNFSIIGL
jgi:hypothetical protein